MQQEAHFSSIHVKRIFLADDHPLIRQIYAEEIEEAEDLTVCGTAASFVEALDALPAAGPDVARSSIYHPAAMPPTAWN